MRAEAFRYFTDQYLTATGLILFIILFISITLWTFQRSKRELYDRMSQLPLEQKN